VIAAPVVVPSARAAFGVASGAVRAADSRFAGAAESVRITEFQFFQIAGVRSPQIARIKSGGFGLGLACREACSSSREVQ